MYNKTILFATIGITTVAAFGLYLGAKQGYSSLLRRRFKYYCPFTRGSKLNFSSTALKSPQEWKEFEVIENKQITHNTHIITFKLPDNATRLGLTMNSCIMARMKLPSGDYHSRPYTPITSEEETIARKSFSLLVKKYPTGTLSRHVCQLEVGSRLELSGPIQKINLEERAPSGQIRSLENVTQLAMLAGGTGITPMLQAADYILRTMPKDMSPKLIIVAANNSQDDILADDILKELVRHYPGRIKVHHVLRDNKNASNTIPGLIDSKVLQSLEVLPLKTQRVFVCGPPPMVAAISGPKAQDKSQGPLSGILQELGYVAEQVFKF